MMRSTSPTLYRSLDSRMRAATLSPGAVAGIITALPFTRPIP
jgi:hypothetical protein